MKIKVSISTGDIITYSDESGNQLEILVIDAGKNDWLYHHKISGKDIYTRSSYSILNWLSKMNNFQITKTNN